MTAICTLADDYKFIEGLSMNLWPMKSPRGITIHYTADSSFERVKKQIELSKIGYHFIILKNGEIIQTASLDYAVNHAGRAVWNNLSPNRQHIAIAFMCWGKLNDKGHTWSGSQVHNPVRRINGTWDIATRDQESSLLKLVNFLCMTYNITAQNVCGHDECAMPPGRKLDPGGSLSMKMADFRKLISF